MNNTRSRRGNGRRRGYTATVPVSVISAVHSGAQATNVSALSINSAAIGDAFRVTSAEFDVSSAKAVTWQIELRGSQGEDSSSTISAPVTTCGSTRHISLRAPRYTDYSQKHASERTHLGWVRSSNTDASVDARFSGIVRISMRVREI